MKLEIINVGRIVGAHGIRGEVRVQPRDGDPAFLTQFSTFLLKGQPVSPTANHVHKSLVLMKFPGVDDMNAALALRDQDLYIRRADAHLPEGECFDDELLGMDVRPQGLHRPWGAGVSDPGGEGGLHPVGGPGAKPHGGPCVGGDGVR